MPVFEYRGLTDAGRTVSGLKEADSAKALRALLRRDNVFLTDVLGQSDGARPMLGRSAAGTSAASGLSKDVDLRKLTRGRVNTDDIAISTRQLSTLLGAGVTLVEALTALVDQVEKEQLKRIFSDVKQRVNEGSALADALTPHQKVFGNLYVNMIRAGEHSGALDQVLLRLADFTENQAKLRQ
ncbi:MAG TPA: type II secretion system F family protein, partial [Myxococcaceae bacterium]|nr:type II secretion system F family protein [Myxococcaceae bacterium]